MSETDEKKIEMAALSCFEGYSIKVPFFILKNVVEMFGDDGWKVLEESYKEFMEMPDGSITKRNMMRFPVLMVKKVAETFGDKGWEALEKSAKEFAEYRFPFMKFLVDDPENARSLGNVFDFEDNLGGLENEWIKTDAKDAVKLETKCPPAEIYKEYPPFCGKFLYFIARDTLKLVNPNVQLEPFDKAKCMVYGDDCCEVKIKLP